MGGGASPTEIRGEAETETKAVRDTGQGVNRVREQERKETGDGSGERGTRGHTETPGKGKGGQSKCAEKSCSGGPGRTLPPPAKAPGAFPGSLVPFRVD